MPEPEYIVSRLNCWIDGCLVVKSAVRAKEEEHWRIDTDALLHEPHAYTQFAMRHDKVVWSELSSNHLI